MTKSIYLSLALLMFISAISAQSPNVTVSSQSLLASNLSMPSSTDLHSPLPIAFNITNIGTSAFNNIFVNITITGPTSAGTSFYTMPLSPGQKESVLVYLPNATEDFGTYYVYMNASYLYNGTRYRAGDAGEYSVFYSQYGIAPKAESGINLLRGVNITYLPYVSSMQQNGSFNTKLGLLNTGSNSIFVNVSVPSKFSGMLSFSTPLLYLGRNQTVIDNLLFRQPAGSGPGTYIIPLMIDRLGSAGSPAQKQTEYLNFFTFGNSSGTSNMYNQVYLYNNTHSASGTIQLYAPSTYGLTDTIAKLMLSNTIVGNQSQLVAYGAQSNITAQGSRYLLQWHIGALPMGQAKYLYYGVKGIRNTSALNGAELVLLSSSSIANENIFRLLNTALPVFYTSTQDNVTVNLLYTGTGPGRVQLGLSVPSELSVSNATQTINATPNQYISSRFAVTPGNSTGTYYLTLTVTSGSISSTYSLPVIVLQSSPTIGNLLSTRVPIFKYVILTIIIIIAVLLLSRSRMPETSQPYRPDMARKLIGIREQIQNYQGKE